jgi:hypothetical protein
MGLTAATTVSFSETGQIEHVLSFEEFGGGVARTQFPRLQK